VSQVAGNQVVSEAVVVDDVVKLVEGGPELGGGWNGRGDDLGQTGP
jgi:hypothetical protein